MSAATKNEHDWYCEEHGIYGWRGDACRKCPTAASEITTLREQVEKLEAAGHRLALELECLLLDCKDNVVVSRWMDTACEALDAWRNLFPYNGPRLRSRRCEVCGYLKHEREHTGCLREQLAALAEQNAKLRKVLLRLACLGNGDQYGNSIGNCIAQEALSLPDLATPVLNRIRAEAMEEAAREPSERG